jgi:hypothetical protein
MSGRLNRPGVDVFQILDSRKPSALRPVMVPAIVGVHKNIQYNLPLAYHYTGVANAATAIPTGLSAVVQQRFVQEADISLFIETDRGLVLLAGGGSDYTVALDAQNGVLNTIALGATISPVKSLVDTGIAATITLSVEGSTKYLIVEDPSVDFSSIGVRPNDDFTLDYASSNLNADPGETLKVSSVESSTKLKLVYSANLLAGTWLDDTLITYNIDTPEMTDVAGQLYVSYFDAVVINDVNTVIEINGAQDIKDNFGTLEPENPLGFHCLTGAIATDRTFYAVRVKEDTDAAYEIALDALKTVDDAYYIVPTSQADNVISLAKTHAEFMSTPYQKGERVAMTSAIIPDYDITDSESADMSCVVTSVTAATTDVTVTGVITGMAPGNILRVTETDMQLGDNSYVDNEAVKLVVLGVAGPVVTVSGVITNLAGIAIGVSTFNVRGTTSSYQGGEKARVMAERSAAKDSQRIVNVSPDTVEASVTRSVQDAPNYVVTTSTAVEAVSGSVAAAAIGCHGSAMTPVQPHTNLAVPGILGAIGSNEELSADNLDVAAGGGNWILLNQRGGGAVTTRHQLTTAVSDVNTREFSVVKSVDYAAKVFRNYLSPLVGKSIITDPFIKKVVGPAASAALYSLTEQGQVSIKSKILAIYQDENDPTRIVVEVDILPLYPANYFTVKLFI